MYRLTIFPSPWPPGELEALSERIARETLERTHGGPNGVLSLWRAYLAAEGADAWPQPDAVVAWEEAAGEALTAIWRVAPAPRPDPESPESGWFDSVINDAFILIEEAGDV